MLKKTVLAGLLIFIFSNFTGIVYGKGKTTGYLQVIYKSFECGLSNPHIYSCYAPFYMKGNKIIGKFEIPEDGKIHLPLVPMVPYDRDKFFKKQIINYSYNCPPGGHGCPPTVVSGNVVVHKVSGEVIKIKGKKCCIL